MFQTTKYAVIPAMLGASLFLAACHRIDDPPTPLAPQGLAALGAESQPQVAPPAAIVKVVEAEPIVVRAKAHEPIVTASDVVANAETTAAENVSLDLRYDPGDEMTIRGPVLGKRFVKLEGGHTAEVVKLMPGDTLIDVMLGTTDFFFRHNIDIGVADPIMVRGHLVRLERRDMLLAREITWRGTTYTVRDKTGWPAWRAAENSSVATVSARAPWRLWW